MVLKIASESVVIDDVKKCMKEGLEEAKLDLEKKEKRFGRYRIIMDNDHETIEKQYKEEQKKNSILEAKIKQLEDEKIDNKRKLQESQEEVVIANKRLKSTFTSHCLDCVTIFRTDKTQFEEHFNRYHD